LYINKAVASVTIDDPGGDSATILAVKVDGEWFRLTDEFKKISFQNNHEKILETTLGTSTPSNARKPTWRWTQSVNTESEFG
jgi:hypothetical protein